MAAEAHFTRHPRFRIAVAVVLLAVAGTAAWFLWTAGRVSTDDAQVDGHVTQMAARVGGSPAEFAAQYPVALEITVERIRGMYRFRRNRFGVRLDGSDDDGIEAQSQDYQRLRRELLDAERMAVVALRNEGKISDDVMQRVTRDLDLEDSRLDV